MDFLKTLHINNSTYTNYENKLLNKIVKNKAEEATLAYATF